MTQNSSPLALYVHWPFCKAKCPYCDFNSHVRESVDAAQWGTALEREIRRGATQTTRRPLTSIFFGGGTPSLMPPQVVEQVLAEAERTFGFAPEIEITLEANPTSVEAERFAAFRRAGVNRLSLGIQSLVPQQLAFLGREHSANEARAAIDLAATHFPRHSFDLIYALPGQTPQQWEAQLTAALPLTNGHLSLYQLTIEPGTRFFHQHQSGQFTLPDEQEAEAFYKLTQQLMQAAGMPAYETSNHAAPGQASRHNLAYWQGNDYLGIGPGAHGRLMRGEQRMATLQWRSPEKWLEGTANGTGEESALPLTQREELEERLIMGLRLIEGIDAAAFAQRTGHPLFTLWKPEILEPLYAEGLLQRNSTHLRPTPRGHLLLSSLTGYLATRLAEGRADIHASAP